MSTLTILNYHEAILETHNGQSLEFFTPYQRKALADITGHLYRTTKINLSSFNKKYKQSEFKVFYSLYKNRINSQLSSVDPMRIVVTRTPEGMKGFYSTVIDDILKILKDYSVKNYIENLQKLLMSIESKIVQGNYSALAKECKEFYSSCKMIDYPLVVDDFIKNNYGNVIYGVQLSNSVFKNKEDIKNAVDNALLFSDTFSEAVDLQNEVKKDDDYLSNIIQYIDKDNPEINKSDFINMLFKITSLTVKILDRYGVILHEMQRIDHNLKIALIQVLDI